MGCGCSKNSDAVAPSHQAEWPGVQAHTGRNAVWPPANIPVSPDGTAVSPVTPDLRKDLLDVPWSSAPGRRIHIWHFGDMRDAGTGIKEPVGGAARMATAIKQAEAALGGRPLVLFSGGACGPSDANTATRGEHPIAVLNALGVKCAVVGSRDTSLGLPRLSSLASRSRFPWLASNASVRHSGEPIPGTSHSVVIEHEGVRVGIIGLLDDAQQPAGPSGVARAGMVETARALAGQVREQGAEVVVALTHARATADKQLCALVPEIDLVLGGLGAAYEVRPVPPHMTWMVRSGGALKTATLVALWTPVDGRRARVECKRVDVTSHFSPCSDVEETLRDLDDHVAEARSVVVGGTATELDVAASIVGLRETPVANLVADVWRSALDAVGGVDLVFLPAACIHGDRALSPGEITTGDVAAMLPATEDVVVILVPGASLVAAIEHSVASWPKPSRVFPVVSGLTFSFNGGKGVGRRVIASSIMVSGEQLDLQRQYRVATTVRAARGQDGAPALSACAVVLPPESTPPLPNALLEHLDTLERATVRRWETEGDKPAEGDERPSAAAAEFRREQSLAAHPMRTQGDADSDGTVEELVPRPIRPESSAGDAPEIAALDDTAHMARQQRPASGVPRASDRAGSVSGTRKDAVSEGGNHAGTAQRNATHAPETGSIVSETLAGRLGMCVWSADLGRYALHPVVDGRIENVARGGRS